MKSLILLFLCFTPSILGIIRRMEIIWLNNGGQILSSHQDWIKLIINTPNLNDSIICTEGRGYTYTPGDTRRFYKLWVPVQTYITISLKQYNFFSKDDAVYIESPVNTSNTGYYTFKLSLEQFRSGVTIALLFEGLGITFNTSDYRAKADYYMLLRLTDTVVANNTYGLESTCRLSLNLNLWSHYYLLHMAMVVALLVLAL